MTTPNHSCLTVDMRLEMQSIDIAKLCHHCTYIRPISGHIHCYSTGCKVLHDGPRGLGCRFCATPQILRSSLSRHIYHILANYENQQRHAHCQQQNDTWT